MYYLKRTSKVKSGFESSAVLTVASSTRPVANHNPVIQLTDASWHRKDERLLNELNITVKPEEHRTFPDPNGAGNYFILPMIAEKYLLARQIRIIHGIERKSSGVVNARQSFNNA